jgi:formate-dependent nitrite reductase cytochrome c552 subunit
VKRDSIARRRIAIGFGNLSNEEQQALDQLQKTCASRHKLSPETLQNCALLKRQQAIIDQQNVQAVQILLAQLQANNEIQPSKPKNGGHWLREPVDE